jgi:N-acetyl sugar amidotransferase
VTILEDWVLSLFKIDNHMTNIFYTDREYQQCTRCIMDTTVPNIKFDHSGRCNYCDVHDNLDKRYSLDGKAQKDLTKIVKSIKLSGQGKKYDCVMGFSGGRDSSYMLYHAKNILGLRPLAVHFNDGFGNPVAGENMAKIAKKLDIDLRTITSDWKESKDLRITGLKASTPDMIAQGADLGIATALYGVAHQERLKFILIGQSFRTEGISPLTWNYLDGDYLRSVHNLFGKNKLRPWSPNDPGFNLGIKEMLYYTIFKRIKTIFPLYYIDYDRSEVDALLEEKLQWENTGAHYYDDLYQSLITKLLREKFNCDRRKTNYSALIRSGQMSRKEALERVKNIYVIEDPKVIDLCIKRLGLTKNEFDAIIDAPAKSFRDYKTNYRFFKLARPLIKLLTNLNILPGTTYDKFFNCG